MRRSALFRLPAPIFLIVCIAWAAYSLISLVCRILIWALLRIVHVCSQASLRFPLKTNARGPLEQVCIARPTIVPGRKPATVVRLDEPVKPVVEKPDHLKIIRTESRDPEYIAKRERLMKALGIVHEDIADRILSKGYPVGW
jgi:hypothetical protein